MPHRRRPQIAPRHPVHVTLRVRDEVWNLRSRRCFRALARAFAVGKERFGLRLIHFSVQGNHLHLIVEVVDAASLSRGMQGLAIRMAKRLNQVMQRTGPVFRERYHAHVLRSPTEVARAPLPTCWGTTSITQQGGARLSLATRLTRTRRRRPGCAPGRIRLS